MNLLIPAGSCRGKEDEGLREINKIPCTPGARTSEVAACQRCTKVRA